MCSMKLRYLFPVRLEHRHDVIMDDLVWRDVLHPKQTQQLVHLTVADVIETREQLRVERVEILSQEAHQL